MNDEDDQLDDVQQHFPWVDVEAARKKERLQRRHPTAEGQAAYAARARACPQCHTAAGQLAWFYFSSPADTWEGLCGRAGWITVCDHCRRQVDFFLEEMN